MANTSAISRGSLILGLCVPLAVLLGYMLAEPMDSATIGVMMLLLSVLCIPILMRWHHPLLILSWNACINPFFFPGRPYLWMLMSLASLFFAMLSRSTDASRRFISAPALTWPLCALGVVVAITACLRGGAGLGVMGSEVQGGRGYYYIALAIVGYFAMISQRIPPDKVGLYMAMFLLSGLTAVVSNLAYFGGPGFYFLYDLFPPDVATSQAVSDISVTGGIARIAGMSLASQAVWLWLFARFGIAGIFDFGRPWRMLLLIISVSSGLLGGFRSILIFFIVIFILLFCLEKMWRSPRVVVCLLLGLTSVLIGLVLFSDHLPLAAQRTLSFLPIRMDSATKQDAEFSTQWRIEIWRRVLPDVPVYLFKGKGYALDPNDIYLATESAQRGNDMSGGEAAMVAGDYHSGPLSVIIPFGIYGTVAFIWFITASIWAAQRNYRFGDERLRVVNRFLLALLIAKTIHFVFIYGSLYAELFQFTGLAGLIVCLNSGIAGKPSKYGAATV